MNTKVVKFGGSSLCDAAHFQKVKSIILADPSRKFVVPSAPGKRSSQDIKITDLLLQCDRLAFAEQPFEDVFSQIKDRYEEIISELGLTLDLRKEYERIATAITHNAGTDYIASRGEYLSGLILAEYLHFDFVDPRKMIFFSENGVLDAEKTNQKVAETLRKHEKAVIPGYYGSMPNGTVKTFSRGGSDITGSIVARAVQADLYENWTDVSGFLMADPRLVDNPKPITTITYRELRELSYMGATVLHEEAIFPVRYAGIPINIRNTNVPEDRGSMIVAAADDVRNDEIITGIAGKKGFSIVAVEKDLMNSEVGFGRKILAIIEKYNLCFEHLPSGIDTMSVIMNTDDLTKYKKEILTDIKESLHPETLYTEDHIALIAVVGRGMVRAKGTAAKIFDALAEKNINIKMIDQGSSELNIIIGVEEKDFEIAVDAIYHAFVV